MANTPLSDEVTRELGDRLHKVCEGLEEWNKLGLLGMVLAETITDIAERNKRTPADMIDLAAMAYSHIVATINELVEDAANQK